MQQQQLVDDSQHYKPNAPQRITKYRRNISGEWGKKEQQLKNKNLQNSKQFNSINTENFFKLIKKMAIKKTQKMDVAKKVKYCYSYYALYNMNKSLFRMHNLNRKYTLFQLIGKMR